jgi:hypothetical protein
VKTGELYTWTSKAVVAAAKIELISHISWTKTHVNHLVLCQLSNIATCCTISAQIFNCKASYSSLVTLT